MCIVCESHKDQSVISLQFPETIHSISYQQICCTSAVPFSTTWRRRLQPLAPAEATAYECHHLHTATKIVRLFLDLEQKPAKGWKWIGNLGCGSEMGSSWGLAWDMREKKRRRKIIITYVSQKKRANFKKLLFRQTWSNDHNISHKQSSHFGNGVLIYLFHLPLKCSDGSDTIYTSLCWLTIAAFNKKDKMLSKRL